jgi:hypothetical protein
LWHRANVANQVTTLMLALQAREVTKQEEAAWPNGKSSVENMVERAEAVTGLAVPPERRALVEQLVHYSLGAVPGAIYGVARRWLPFARFGNGLGFGLAVFAVNDEYLNARLGFSGPPTAYPPETHMRGLAGHAILGVATETGIQLLGG